MLYGLLAALLPLAIHLLNRRRTVTLPFSNVALLQTLQHDRMRRVKLKQILLLLLRTLLIVLLVLAFARPTQMGATGSGRDAGTSAVVLLDRSVSMQHRTPSGMLFDRARARVAELMTSFGTRDEVQLFLVDAQAVPFEIATHSLDMVQPGFGPMDMRTGLETALVHLGTSQQPNREVYIFSDMANKGWANVPDTLAGLAGISVFLVPERPELVHNLGILDARPVGEFLQVGRPATLAIDLINHGDAPKGDVPVQVFLNDRRMAQQVAHVPARGRRKVHVRFTPETGGALPLRVEIGDDDLAADNMRVSVLAVPDRIRVLLVGEAASEAYYLAQALQVASFDVVQKHPDELSEAVLRMSDVVFLCNVPTLSRSAIDALRQRLDEGAGLGIVLGDRVDIRHYNAQVLPALLPATLVSVQGRPGATTAYQTLQPLLPDHPLLADLEMAVPFRSPQFYAHYAVRPDAGTQPVLSFATGMPALLENRLGNGRAVLFTSGLNAELAWNDLPMTGFFVPFVHRLAGYMAAGAFGQSNYPVGQMVYRDMRGVAAREAVLRPPGQEAQAIWAEHRGARAVWPVGSAHTPGLWEIFARERLADRFAVQMDAMEADLTPVADARLASLFQEAHLHIVAPDVRLMDVVMAQRRGRELWRPVLGAALLLMAIEMLIVRSTQTRRNPV